MTGAVGAICASGQNPVANPLAAGSVLSTTPTNAAIVFNTDGSISYIGTTVAGPANWSTNPRTGAGTGIWVQFTHTAGAALSSNDAPTPTEISANRRFDRTTSGGQATVRVDFYSDSGGTNLLCSSSGWTVEEEP